jgi:hypothetical protein
MTPKKKILITAGMHKSRAQEVRTVAPNICGCSVWNMLRVTFLAPRILRWIGDFWKICYDVLRSHSFVQSYLVLKFKFLRNSVKP